MAETLVIVPTYNEAESLVGFIGRLRQSVPAADVLIVDDGSPDGTGDIADRLAESDPSISVLHRERKSGLGRAYLAGFERGLDGGYDYLVEIDADGSHDPADLSRMLGIAESGADLVLGSRWVPGGTVLNWPWQRRAISRLGNGYARFMLRSKLSDLTAGLRVFRAEALRSVDLSEISSQGYCFQIELAWTFERAAKEIAEHPITFIERSVGRSKMHLGIVVEALLRVTVWGFTRARR